MSVFERRMAQIILAATVIGAAGWAQEQPKGNHVNDLRQSREFILKSSLCQQAREHSSEIDLKWTGRRGIVHNRTADPATIARDLPDLMQKSDEVVLAGVRLLDAEAIAPSGQDAIHYFDVIVFHTWKGKYKVGEKLTFAVPAATLNCDAETIAPIGPAFSTLTEGEVSLPYGPYVLFLRHAQGEEKEVTPDLRLTGTDGIQGMFDIRIDPNAQIRRLCNGVLDDSTDKCLEYLKTSLDKIYIPYRHDPLLKEYAGMSVSTFLKEVQSVANSLGYRTQANGT
jgi:hypothetical protein